MFHRRSGNGKGKIVKTQGKEPRNPWSGKRRTPQEQILEMTPPDGTTAGQDGNNGKEKL